ncbi:hypothetical protein ACJBUE_09525 [Ralstonia syzygii subsp. celebesensis]|nr:hypothetical protein [Ralstonia syzygii]
MTLDQRDLMALLGQRVRCTDADDAGAHNRDLHELDETLGNALSAD